VFTQMRQVEMEVTEIILAKFPRLCQLSSQSRGLLSRLLIFKSIGPSLRISFTSYDTKMLLKVVSDKTAFVKFKISKYKTLMKPIQNKQKSIRKSILAYEF
jgi:hypothetical protein